MVQDKMRFVKFMLQPRTCSYISSRSQCKFCVLLEHLAAERP